MFWHTLMYFLITEIIHTPWDSVGKSWGLLADFLVLGAVCALPGQQGWGLASAHGSRSGSQCPPLEPKMMAVTCPTPGAPIHGVLLPGTTHRERSSYGGPTPLLMCLPIMMTCLSGGHGFLPSTTSVAMAQLLQAVSAPNPGPLPGTELQSLSFSTRPPPSQTEECLRLRSPEWRCQPSLQVSFSSAFHKPVGLE